MAANAIERFERDTEADRAVARLRGTGGFIVLASAGVLMLGQGGTLRWLWVMAGVLAGLGWIAAWRRSRAMNHEDSLKVGPEGLKMSVRGKETSVDWAEVVEVEADEERLVVRLVVRRAQDAEAVDFLVPLVWKGTGLHSLTDILAARLEEFQNEHAEQDVTSSEPPA